MATSLVIPVAAQAVRFVPESDEAREARVWEDGKAYAERARKTDSKGRGLFQFTALVELNGVRIGSIGVESPQALPETVALGTVFQGSGGSASLTVSNNRDGFDLKSRLLIDGFEPAK